MQHVMLLRVSRPLRPTILHQIVALSGCHAVTTRLTHGSTSNAAPSTDEQPTVVSEDGSRTLRSRKHGNNSLSLPVLMDPILQQARQKHHERKPRGLNVGDEESEARREFREKLASNVHAHALATKVRLCQVTRARLPAHFLIPLIAEMPILEDPGKSFEPEATNIDASEMVRSNSKGPNLVPAFDRPRTGSPSSYLLATKKAFDHTCSKRGRLQILVNERMKKRYSAHIGQNLERASADWLDKTRNAWPAEQSMPDAVLAALRRRVVNCIAWCAKQEDESIPGGSLMCQTVLGGIEDVGEDELEVSESRHDPPRLLYVLNPSSFHNAAGEHIGRSGAELAEDEYDLLELLGPELCEELKEKHVGEWRDGRAPILLRHPNSVKTVMALEKLRNYLNGANE